MSVPAILPEGADVLAMAASEPDDGTAPEIASTDVMPSESASERMDAPRMGQSPASPLTGSGGRRRPVRYGLSLQFASCPDDPELGRLVDSTVFINDSHPAYVRAVASRAQGYHLALSVAMTLAPLAVEPAEGRAFVTAFLETWGRAVGRKGTR